jgi:hypothetical protein
MTRQLVRQSPVLYLTSSTTDAYQFSFIRLSLRCQSTRPGFHLDSDAATALTGDPARLHDLEIHRLLVNLSSTTARNLHYLDVDPAAVPLQREGGYVRLADGADGADVNGRERLTSVPHRAGESVFAVSFIANRIMHSGVDDAAGHFVAAYGHECEAASSQRASSCP